MARLSIAKYSVALMNWSICEHDCKHELVTTNDRWLMTATTGAPYRVFLMPISNGVITSDMRIGRKMNSDG